MWVWSPGDNFKVILKKRCVTPLRHDLSLVSSSPIRLDYLIRKLKRDPSVCTSFPLELQVYTPESSQSLRAQHIHVDSGD